MKLVILGLAKVLGLFALSSWLTRHRLRILAYHGIWFLEGHFGNHLFMSPTKFRTRMTWLKDSKYHVKPLDQALEEFSCGNISPYTTVITIDDGWYGTYAHMLPVLEQAALPASLYVYTGAVESQNVLPNILIPALVQLSRESKVSTSDLGVTDVDDLDISNTRNKQLASEKLVAFWQQLDAQQSEHFCLELMKRLGFDAEEMLQSRQFSFMSFEDIADAYRRGLDIQLHTHTHTCDIGAPEKIVAEIRTNREKLAPHVQSTLKHFCYPSGVSSAAMHPYLAENGVSSATLTDTGLVEPDSNPYALKRILDGEQVSQLEFEGELSGFLDLLRGLKRRLA